MSEAKNNNSNEATGKEPAEPVEDKPSAEATADPVPVEETSAKETAPDKASDQAAEAGASAEEQSAETGDAAAKPAPEKVKDLIKYMEERNLREDLPHFQVGDTVRVSIKITEKDKTRIQNFDGVVISISGRRACRVFTVRRISFGVGVEKTFPINSPVIAGIKLLRAGVVRRAKLYYLRGLSGKAGRIKEDERRLLLVKQAKTVKKKVKEEAPRAAAPVKTAKKKAARDKKKSKRQARKKAKTTK